MVVIESKHEKKHMLDVNGFKLAQPVAWAVIVGLILAGSAYGTLLSGQIQMGTDIREIRVMLRESFMPRLEVTTLKTQADREHDLLRKELDDLRKEIRRAPASR